MSSHTSFVQGPIFQALLLTSPSRSSFFLSFTSFNFFSPFNHTSRALHSSLPSTSSAPSTAPVAPGGMGSRIEYSTAQSATERLVRYIREHAAEGDAVYVWAGLPMEEVLERTPERFCFAPLNNMEASDQWMISTIQALGAYSDQQEMVARKTEVEAWNSRSLRSILFMVWREALCATHTTVSNKEAKRRQIQYLRLGLCQSHKYRREENRYEAILQVFQQARSTPFSEEEVNVFLMTMSR